MSSSHIQNLGPWLLLQISVSWDYLHKLLIWWLKKGVQLLIWLWNSTVDQNKVFNPWFQLFCQYTCIDILCYIHLCQWGTILIQVIIIILVICGILWITIYCNTYTNTGLFIFNGNCIVYHFVWLLFGRFPLSSCNILNYGPQLFLRLRGSRAYFQQDWNKGFVSLFMAGFK